MVCAAFVAMGLTYRLLHVVVPAVRGIVRALQEEWPAVRVADGRFEILNDVPPLQPIALPNGWRILLDPQEELLAPDIKPRTLVIQQGRCLAREPDGTLHRINWKTGSTPRVVDGNFFARVDRLLLSGVVAVGALLFVPSLAAVLLLAGVASGFLLLLEFLGAGPAPSSVFGWTSFLILPFGAFYMMFSFWGLPLSKSGFLLAVAYFATVLLSKLWARSRFPGADEHRLA